MQDRVQSPKNRLFYKNSTIRNHSCRSWFVLAQGQTQGSAPRAHQQALTTGPFGNTCEADAVSPEAVMRGLQDRDVYNQGEYQVDLIQEQHNIHISPISLDLLCTSTYHI
jgi:hypothetical protein